MRASGASNLFVCRDRCPETVEIEIGREDRNRITRCRIGEKFDVAGALKRRMYQMGSWFNPYDQRWYVASPLSARRRSRDGVDGLSTCTLERAIGATGCHFKGTGLPIVGGASFRHPARQRHHQVLRQNLGIRFIQSAQIVQCLGVTGFSAEDDALRRQLRTQSR